MKTNPYFDAPIEGRPRILAHRGLTFQAGKKVADENTLQAFELACSVGSDYLESDIRVTSDGQAVLFHDPTLKLPSGKLLQISKLTLSGLQAVSLPYGGRIPTLEEALTEFPRAKFNLDLKVTGAIDPSIQIIAGLGATERVLLTSFSERTRQQALAKLGQRVATSPGSSLALRSWIATQQLSQRGFLKLVSNLDAIQVPAKMYGINFTKPSFIEAVLASNLELHFWTINEPNQMKALFAAGATGIVTDRADLAMTAFS